MSGSEHWDGVYGARAEDALTWFEPSPDRVLTLARRHGLHHGPILDVGGGASRFVDACLADGLGPVTVLDMSSAALEASKRRLGADAERATWIVADITRWTPDRVYRLWHDRAAFHFLTNPADQDAYLATLDTALSGDGGAILSTFAEDGPESCSGLSVRRYSPASLAERIEAALPGRFTLVDSLRHAHVSPRGVEQAFQYSVFRRATSV